MSFSLTLNWTNYYVDYIFSPFERSVLTESQDTLLFVIR